METLFQILFRSSVSLALFFVLYWSLLRKSTHFKANRYFLLGTLLLSLVIAFFPVQYDVLIKNATTTTENEFTEAFRNIPDETQTIEMNGQQSPSFNILLIIYLVGIAFLLLRLFVHTYKPIRILLQTKPSQIGNRYIIENNHYSLPFSFFNRIFINPKYHKQEELADILAHENVHIRERHWVDLLFIELLTVLLWFNPFIWLFEHAIKQNHEYLADEGVLSRGHSPVRYQALLINQLMGMQVIGLANNLNFALGPTRLKMMNKKKTPRKKLARMALGIPALAILLVAFAEPKYQTVADDEATSAIQVQDNSAEKITVSGTVLTDDGTPLYGASVILQGTTIGTVADKDGKFELKVSKDHEVSVVASFVGYKTKINELNVQENDKKLTFNIVMEKEVVLIDTNFPKHSPPPPPPPPTPEFETTGSDEVFFVVEEMPHYPFGYYGLGKYVKAKQAVLNENKKLKGKATVGFTVNTKGEVTNIQVLDKTNDNVAEAAKTIVAGMENWQPGKQRGKPVSVNFALPFEF